MLLNWKLLSELVCPLSIIIYSLSDLGVSSNLIGSLSLSNWALFIPHGVNGGESVNSGRIFTWPLRSSLNILPLFTSISKKNNNYYCSIFWNDNYYCKFCGANVSQIFLKIAPHRTAVNSTESHIAFLHGTF